MVILLIGRAAYGHYKATNDDESTANSHTTSLGNPLLDNDVESNEGGGLQLQPARDSLASALSDVPLGQSLVQAWRNSDMQVTETLSEQN